MTDPSTLKLVALAALQGLTEFLPVSSSGHLVLAQRALGVQAPGPDVELFLHLGTLVSICVFYRRRLLELLGSFLRGKREGWLYAAWVAVALFGAVPLWASGAFASATDAVFESVSGFTTTGATVLADVEAVPRAVNVWRCETHWLGGMGVIALVVALVPLLGIGGFRLLSAESTGPEKGRLTARIADTAKVLWLLYVALTALQAALLRLCGMGWLDAVCHAFSTLGTGGFSTRNASLAAFASPAAEWVCTAFMLAASLPFALYYRLLARRGEGVRRATEPKVFLAGRLLVRRRSR